ncbi:glycosyltransferase [Ligilactobacillus equi]|uniref:Glycosyltransferase 2-like domain-containing protein n=1 Tax=Ligilactobacillus equi DSM 15833 = JCM 10991 TaxID=1423740 RepID=A0A0R1T474_9LACO|nr:glycosyltransferase [Ligilactobacillus equi]KRL76582.1 hypothetical protein FC36_GL001912 [Ligilactobacillus equi DSM 15833 = JCM 10991]
MKLSIVMSTYNGQKYILEQLESLRLQKRQADEVLIFDDGSTDETVQIITSYIEEHGLNTWNLTINPQNKGWRRNFMEGMWQSTGDLVFTCDQDDIWREDKLEIMEKIMSNHSEISLLVSNYEEFFENGKSRIGYRKNTKHLEKVELKNNYLLVQNPGCTHCIRRSLLDISKRYWQPHFAHDALLWRLAIFADSLYIYTDSLIKWRNHKTSAFAKESKDLKTVKEKKKWIESAQSFNDTLKAYLAKDVSGNKENQLSVLRRNDNWLNIRRKFYCTKNPFIGLRLVTYWDCFPRYRQYLGEWYLIYIKRR